MSDARTQRPDLAPTLAGAELLRWYWLKSELISLARLFDVATSGSKEELTTRLAAVLDGHAPPQSSRAAGPLGDQLSGDLSASTVIPPGQRSSQELRGWFRAHVGPSFRFDRHMRDFIQSADGMTTLGDAVQHWESTRNEPVTVIDPQDGGDDAYASSPSGMASTRVLMRRTTSANAADTRRRSPRRPAGA